MCRHFIEEREWTALCRHLTITHVHVFGDCRDWGLNWGPRACEAGTVPVSHGAKDPQAPLCFIHHLRELFMLFSKIYVKIVRNCAQNRYNTNKMAFLLVKNKIKLKAFQKSPEFSGFSQSFFIILASYYSKRLRKSFLRHKTLLFTFIIFTVFELTFSACLLILQPTVQLLFLER